MGRLTKILSIVLLALFIQQSHADDQDRALQLLQAGEILPLEQILKISRQQHDGHILEVELEQEHGTLIYELEILNKQGHVWEIKIDARSGIIIEQQRE